MKSNNQIHKRCPYCPAIVSSKNMARHKKNRHNYIPHYRCSFCLRVFLSRSTLRDHRTTDHRQEMLTCSNCQQQFRTSSTLKSHRRRSSCKIRSNSTATVPFTNETNTDDDENSVPSVIYPSIAVNHTNDIGSPAHSPSQQYIQSTSSSLSQSQDPSFPNRIKGTIQFTHSGMESSTFTHLINPNSSQTYLLINLSAFPTPQSLTPCCNLLPSLPLPSLPTNTSASVIVSQLNDEGSPIPSTSQTNSQLLLSPNSEASATSLFVPVTKDHSKAGSSSKTNSSKPVIRSDPKTLLNRAEIKEIVIRRKSKDYIVTLLTPKYEKREDIVGGEENFYQSRKTKEVTFLQLPSHPSTPTSPWSSSFIKSYKILHNPKYQPTFDVDGIYGKMDDIFKLLHNPYKRAPFEALNAFICLQVNQIMQTQSAIDFQFLPMMFCRFLESLQPEINRSYLPSTINPTTILIAPLYYVDHYYFAKFDFNSKTVYVADSSWHHLTNADRHSQIDAILDAIREIYPFTPQDWSPNFDRNCTQQICDISCGYYTARFATHSLHNAEPKNWRPISEAYLKQLPRNMANQLLQTTPFGRHLLKFISAPPVTHAQKLRQQQNLLHKGLKTPGKTGHLLHLPVSPQLTIQRNHPTSQMRNRLTSSHHILLPIRFRLPPRLPT